MRQEFVIEKPYEVVVFRRVHCTAKWELVAMHEHTLDAVRFAFSASMISEGVYYVFERGSAPILVAKGQFVKEGFIQLFIKWQ